MGYVNSAKKIKFNLRCDEKSIRTVEDLQHNFVIEDILEYYENGLLQRWLDVRGYEAEKDMIDQLKDRGIVNPLEVIRELSVIFHVEDNISIIERDTYVLEYEKERRNTVSKCLELDERAEDLIEKYFNQYESIIQNILSNNADYSRIKAAVDEIALNYTFVFAYDYWRLLREFEEKAPLAIYIMLMNDIMREQYLHKDEICRDTIVNFNEKICGIVKRGADNEGYKQWMKFIKLGEGSTEGNWRTLAYRSGRIGDSGCDEGKKCLILTLGKKSGTTSKPNISEYDRHATPYSIDDIKDKFMILDGLEYQCSWDNGYVIYMEV